MENPFTLQGKRIVITGASSGIGRECAITCSKLGAAVILLGRDQSRLGETAEILPDGARHSSYSQDLTDFDQVESLVARIVQENGRIDGVINSAGISATLPLKVSTPERLTKILDTNVTASVNFTQIVTSKKYFAEEGGSVIFLSSVMSVVGEVAKTMYSISKGGLLAGARSMALELAPRKIRVNAVSPGVVESPMSKNAVYSQSEEALQRVTALHPLGLGRTEDVANACAFLLSDAARWITGTNLIIDGGYTAR